MSASPMILRQVDRINFDIEAKAFRDAVLSLASQHGCRIEVVAAALADTLAIAAAKLDQEGDTFTMADRLHAFCARVEETYEKLRG